MLYRSGAKRNIETKYRSALSTPESRREVPILRLEGSSRDPPNPLYKIGIITIIDTGDDMYLPIK